MNEKKIILYGAEGNIPPWRVSKYVHFENGTFAFGDFSKIDHWEITGADRETARNMIVKNAGLAFKTNDYQIVLASGSGELTCHHGDISRLLVSEPDLKKQLDRESVNSLNEIVNRDVFISLE